MKQTKIQTCLSKPLLALILVAAFFSCKKSDNKPVALAPVISYNKKIVSVNVGEAIPTLIPDSSKGGSVTQYSIYPGLPKGLSLNQSNGVISGTPADSLNPTRFIISAYGPGGLGRDTITVAVGTVGFVYGSTGNYTFTIGSQDLAVTALAPTVLAGTFKKFFIDPSQNSNDITSKTGLNFDLATGKISGTPSKLTNSTTEVPTPLMFVITGITQDNKAAYDTIYITINDVAPTGLSYPFRGSFVSNVAMGSNLSPINSLGAAPGTFIKKYVLAPGSNPLPEGVHLDSTKGYIGQVYNPNTGVTVVDTPKNTTNINTTVTIRAMNTGGYQDITVPIVINTTADAPQIKYMMSFLTGNVTDTICSSINSGDVIYLTKHDNVVTGSGPSVPTVYLNPVVLKGLPKSGGFTVGTITPAALGGMSLGSNGTYSGTPAYGTATTTPAYLPVPGTYTGTVTIKNAALGTTPDGTFGLNVVLNNPFFTYNSGGAAGSIRASSVNIYNFVQGQNVTAPVTGSTFTGYTTTQLSPVGGTDVTSYTIYPGNTTTAAFSTTGLTFNTTNGTISGTPTISTIQSGIYQYLTYVIVGKKADHSFTYYQIRIRVFNTSADWLNVSNYP